MTLVGRFDWSVYYDEAEPGICVYVYVRVHMYMHVCYIVALSQYVINNVNRRWEINICIKEKRERVRESKNNQRPIWRTKKKKERQRGKFDRQSAFSIELIPFRLFSSLSLCLRQRSDQTESTISEAITSDGRSDNKNIYIDDPASLFCTIFCTIVSKVSK